MDKDPKSRNGSNPPVEKRFFTRVVRGKFPGREFDIFWQAQGDEAIFSAVWDMIVLAEEFKYGRKPTFQRTVTKLQRPKNSDADVDAL